jgi:O-antigen/teichoic acid export membrane protein
MDASEKVVSNIRIAKNSFLLYFRMLVSTVLSLYTSRVILDILGVEDFGIYGIVGSITAILTYLNTSMSSATSRFLTYEMGFSNTEKLNKTFSTARIIHIVIAIFILILGETVGLWFLENKLIISDDRMIAARWIYQLSLAGAMITVTQVPYNASVLAHEQMKIYAYVEILKSCLNLGAVFLLKLGNFDKLILYAMLFLCVSFIIAMIYRIYCILYYSECKSRFYWDVEIIKPIFAFSGWRLYESLCVAARGQGINILLNLFFGTITNAAYGIAMQVQNAMTSFVFGFLNAVNPQIVKRCAAGKTKEMLRLFFIASKISFLLVFVLSLPLIIENRLILNFWLKKVPEYTVFFCQLILIERLVYSMFAISTFVIAATGKIRRSSILSGTIFLLVIPISYFLLKNWKEPTIPFILNIILLFFGFMAIFYSLHLNIKAFSIYQFFRQVVFIDIYLIITISVLPLFFHFFLKEGFFRFIIVLFSSVISGFFFAYWSILDKEMRQKGKDIMTNKIKTLLLKKQRCSCL